jgi:hypothetical protein
MESRRSLLGTKFHRFNDVGAANFLADIHCTDFHGLADLEVPGTLLHRSFDPQFMDHLARSRKSFVATVDDNRILEEAQAIIRKTLESAS